MLSRARNSIREAAGNGSMISTHEDADYVPHGPMYKNANAFHRYIQFNKILSSSLFFPYISSTQALICIPA